MTSSVARELTLSPSLSLRPATALTPTSKFPVTRRLWVYDNSNNTVAEDPALANFIPASACSIKNVYDQLAAGVNYTIGCFPLTSRVL